MNAPGTPPFLKLIGLPRILLRYVQRLMASQRCNCLDGNASLRRCGVHSDAAAVAAILFCLGKRRTPVVTAALKVACNPCLEHHVHAFFSLPRIWQTSPPFLIELAKRPRPARGR